MAELNTEPTTILRRKEVERRIGLGRSAIYSKLQSDPSFPRPVRIGVRAVGWIAREVDAWLQDQIASSRNA